MKIKELEDSINSLSRTKREINDKIKDLKTALLEEKKKRFLVPAHWNTANDGDIMISSMSDTHLVNAMNMMIRKHGIRVAALISIAYEAFCRGITPTVEEIDYDYSHEKLSYQDYEGFNRDYEDYCDEPF